MQDSDNKPLREDAMEAQMETAMPALRTKRLLLRPFEPEDVDDALNYRNDPEFARFLPHIPQPYTREDAEAHKRGSA